MNRTIGLSLIDREHGNYFIDNHPAEKHPMDSVASASLRFREHDIRRYGTDFHRVVLILTGDVPLVGLKLKTEPYDWERQYHIQRSICCRESVVPYCERVFAIMVQTHVITMFARDIGAVAGHSVIAIGALASILMGYRENNTPPLVATWPKEESVVVDPLPETSVLIALHVNNQDRRGDRPTWRVIHGAKVTKNGVTVDDVQFNGFAGLRRLALNM